MPRIRTIKPEVWESEKLGRLSLLARLNFVGLISLADDEGRGRGDNAFLLARLHPYAEDVKLSAMQKALLELESVGLAVFYQVSGCSYYAIPTWTENQKIDRPSASKFPEPTKGAAGVVEDSSNARRTFDESSLLDQGSRIMDQGSSIKDDGFESFWWAYPKHQAKTDAQKAWGKLKPDKTLLARILEALEGQKKAPGWQQDAGKWIPLPASWLRGRRWEDEVAEAGQTSIGGRTNGKYDSIVKNV